MSTIAFAISSLIFVNIVAFCVSVAQWIARRTSNPKVVGSNPTRDENYFIDIHINNNHILHLRVYEGCL